MVVRELIQSHFRSTLTFVARGNSEKRLTIQQLSRNANRNETVAHRKDSQIGCEIRHFPG